MHLRIGSPLMIAALLISLLPISSSAGQQAAIDKYCAMLHSLDDNERETAVAELAKIGRPAVPGAIAALGGDEVYLGRAGAALVLGRIRDDRAIGPLVAALGDEYALVRQNASWALAQIGERRTVDAILAALPGGSDVFLEAAAAALGLLKDKRALPELEKLTGHQNPDVARAAADSIKLLSRK
jgi:HEAT repeat protein